MTTTRKECPHCSGHLVDGKLPNVDYQCIECFRGWHVDQDGNWLALFDSSYHIYDKNGRPFMGTIEQAQEYYRRALKRGRKL